MNREELEDLKITKISEEEYERLKDSDEGEAMEVSIDSLKAEQEKLKESAEPVVMAVAELFFARMANTRALKEGLELQ